MLTRKLEPADEFSEEPELLEVCHRKIHRIILLDAYFQCRGWNGSRSLKVSKLLACGDGISSGSLEFLTVLFERPYRKL
ncbi:hypothetical protein AMD24_00363 [Candidatus Xiphinematobacter sp. Idaho Grape]|nr:hypothetical protein AMD24_00363 [Candidatus Xiphinematobacter sp. Idaho Grape]